MLVDSPHHSLNTDVVRVLGSVFCVSVCVRSLDLQAAMLLLLMQVLTLLLSYCQL